MAKNEKNFKYPGTREAMDGNTAVIMCERESTDAAGAYPITPSTQMGEYWAEEAANGHLNISDRPLIFIEPEGEHAAAAVTAGLSMTGLRASNFSSGQGIAYMHESLYAAVGKRLTYILNVGARAMTKSTLNVHAGHDDYHCVDDTGFFQMFGKNAQQVTDLNIISHRIAELALTPGIIAQDGFLTTHLIESLMLPERELIAEYLGKPDDIIDTPTEAQKIIYGDMRRRIPEIWTVDNPVMAGIVQNQDAYMQSVAAQRPFFFDHIQEITDRSMKEFYDLTGREYARVETYRAEDADYLIIGQGSVVPSAEMVADYIRETRGIKVGVVNMVMFRPFPSDLISKIIKGKKGVTVLERLDQPLAVDLPIMREIRATVSKAIENGKNSKNLPYPDIATYSASDAPALYSGSFGMGSRDLQPEGLIGTIENMLPDGDQKKLFYLSIDFIREHAASPKQEIYQQTIQDAYPHVKDLAVHGSENPNLMPDKSITVRFHSVGGWGAITTGKNLAMTLFDLLGYHIKANPKYGSEKKGQPTTYYLSAAPEPIRINCEYFYVDIVLSPDPNVFNHTNALAGLKKGGTFIIQSDQPTPELMWESIPTQYQQYIILNEIKVFYIDAFKIAREEASNVDLQFRMQGIAFQGAFFAASTIMKDANLTEETLFKAIEEQLQHKFSSKGARVVEDNLRVVRRGFTEITELHEKTESTDKALSSAKIEPKIPVMLKRAPASDTPLTDIHRFWEQTGNFYLRGMGNDNLTDPFIGLSCIPAVTAVFRDMTGIRFDHPEWDAEKCTGCGKCWTICPDTAIPGLISDFSGIIETVVGRLKKAGNELAHLPKASRQMEGKWRALVSAAGNNESVMGLQATAIQETITASALTDSQKDVLVSEFELFSKEMEGLKYASTSPFFSVLEKKNKNSGGLLSITINPYTCKGCMECVEVCGDDALKSVKQTKDSVKELQRLWDYYLELPNTPQRYIRIDNLEEGIGALETLLLDREAFLAVASGDGACVGCSEKTIVRLFVATVEALMQPRIAKQINDLTSLIERLEKHIQLKLLEGMSVEEMGNAVGDVGKGELTLSSLTAKLEQSKGSQTIDQEWLRWATQLVKKLKNLKWNYTDGISGRGRSKMGMLNSTGCTSVWGSTYPFNPYPFPWSNHLFQDSPSLAMGIFEGHMSKMADGFVNIRKAEMELNGGYNAAESDEFFKYFNWNHFTTDEFLLCPPVVALGGDGAMYDIGFQNLSRALMSGKPIKIMVLDTQVYSNTGGQACTSGFIGQVSDMAQYGKAFKGKEEYRKEIGLIGMAHRTSYILQSVTANTTHMLEGFIEGLMTKRPALFNLYTTCQPEHGVPDDVGAKQAKLALESRAYPIFKYNPDKGQTAAECFDLEGNPAMHEEWPTYKLDYSENGQTKSMDLPMTFADFAVTEGRFRKQFKKAPVSTWNDSMVPLHEFLHLDESDREDQFPFIWGVDNKNELMRIIVAEPMVKSCEERQHFWNMLKGIAGVKPEVDEAGVEDRIRTEVISNIASGLMQMAGGNAANLTNLAMTPTAASTDTPVAAANDNYMEPWLDTEDCTSCDECVGINPKIFAYNADGKAEIVNPNGGPYQDLVKASEKCPAEIIHPGLPADLSAKDVDKWIKRGEKFN